MSAEHMSVADQIAGWFGERRFADICRWAGASGENATALHVQARQLVALSFAFSGQGKVAEMLLRNLVREHPDDPQVAENLGVLLLNERRLAEALPVLEVVCERQPDAANARFNLGLVQFGLQQYDRAAASLHFALRSDPSNDGARLYLARCLEEMGRVFDVNELLRGWSPKKAFTLEELYELGQVLIAAEQHEHATAAYTLILQNHPGDARALISLAALAERANRIRDARGYLDQVGPSDREAALYLLTSAKITAREKQDERALQELDDAALRLEAMPEARRLRLHSEIEFQRGHALDRLGRHGEAFAAFSSANEAAKKAHRRFNAPNADKPVWPADDPTLDLVVWRAASWSAASRSPIFLVGFPRSGTTLLDRILAAHPRLQVLEEKPVLEAVEHAIQRQPGGLAALDESGAAELRRHYWRIAEEHVRAEGCDVVDKFPFNIGRLHLGMTLFPEARWIFAVRHPLDVVLSCFMQNFRFTDATRGFWTIDGAAEIYEAAIGRWLAQRARLTPRCFDLRYESLVDDFEGETRRLLEFLGLPWLDDLRDFHEVARRERIPTPSYHQVVEPVNSRARGRWRNYQPWMGGAMRRLQPLIATLGYPDPERDR